MRVELFWAVPLAATLVGLADVAVAQKQQVAIVGCAELGKQKQCVMLRDQKGNLYDISQANPLPPLKQKQQQIYIHGLVGAKKSACGGLPLYDVTWQYFGGNCK